MRIVLTAAGGALVGIAATLMALRFGAVPDVSGSRARDSTATLSRERGVDLGPDGARISAIRVAVATGTVNGAGTDNPVLIWFGDRSHELAEEPARAFTPGESVSATLIGGGVPETVGELRRSSILLTLHLGRAAIAASWYCDRVSIEVRLEGETDYRPYLERRDVGWLSLDEPPRRSPAFAPQ